MAINSLNTFISERVPNHGKKDFATETAEYQYDANGNQMAFVLGTNRRDQMIDPRLCNDMRLALVRRAGDIF